MNKKHPIEIIKIKLIEACINYDPKSFRPYLVSPNVQTDMPSKAKFFNFFKGMIQAAKKKTIGKMTAKITFVEQLENKIRYELGFFDEKHLHARLTFTIIETKDTILIEMIPF